VVNPAIIIAIAQPYKRGLAYDMIFGNKAKEAGIGRIVPIVAHHPVIIHFECVAGNSFAIDVSHIIFFCIRRIVFVNLNNATVQREIFRRELNRFTLFRNAQRTKIVLIPFEMLFVIRESSHRAYSGLTSRHHIGAHIGNPAYSFYFFYSRVLHLINLYPSEWIIFEEADKIFLHKIRIKSGGAGHRIADALMWIHFILCTVDIKHAIFDFDKLTWQPYTAFDIIFALIYRACNHMKLATLIDSIPAVLSHIGIIVMTWELQ